MSDEHLVTATLESVAQQIRELASRFDGVDRRFDELSAQLRTEIEAVRGDVRLVAEAFGAQTSRNEQHDVEHARLTQRIWDHDVRILALEKTNRG